MGRGGSSPALPSDGAFSLLPPLAFLTSSSMGACLPGGCGADVWGAAGGGYERGPGDHLATQRGRSPAPRVPHMAPSSCSSPPTRSHKGTEGTFGVLHPVPPLLQPQLGAGIDPVLLFLSTAQRATGTGAEAQQLPSHAAQVPPTCSGFFLQCGKRRARGGSKVGCGEEKGP